MSKIKRRIFRYFVEIEIDEKEVFEKFQNYKYNYNNPKELADSIMFNLQHEGGCNMSKNGMNDWGYSIKISKIQSEKV
jgi:hypothetical protein